MKLQTSSSQKWAEKAAGRLLNLKPPDPDEIIWQMASFRLCRLIESKRLEIEAGVRTVADALSGQPNTSCRLLFDQDEVRYLYDCLGGDSGYRNDHGYVADLVFDRVRSVLDEKWVFQALADVGIEIYAASDLRIRLSNSS